MTTKQKAEAFDLIATGTANGMSLFWERFDKMQKTTREHGDGEALREMAKLAAEEAAREVLCVAQRPN